MSGLDRRADEVHRGALVADLHAHPLLSMTYAGRDPSRRGRPPILWNPLRQHWDLPRAVEGGVDLQIFTIYVPVWPVRRRPVVAEMRRQIEIFEAFVAAEPERVGRARSVAEARTIAGGGRLAAMLAVEGGHALGGSIEPVADLAAAGVTYLTLTHFVPNGIADTSDVFWKGSAPLTDLGRRLIGELERHGILVDTAHCSDAAFRAVADVATGPLVVTHTGLRALCPIERNLPDDHLRIVADSGGVVGVIVFPPYLARRRVLVDLEAMVDHIAHVAEVVGPEHAAIGTDFDGMIWSVRGLPDVARLPRLTEALLARGFAETEVEGILGGNFLRVLESVESRRLVPCA